MLERAGVMFFFKMLRGGGPIEMMLRVSSNDDS
jgi:hypothetical protein